MKKLEKYLGDKTYMFPNGVLATPEKMLGEFPAILTFVHVIETDENGEVCFAVQNLSALRTIYNIDNSLTENEAIEKIQELINTPQETSNESTEERTAAALEEIANGTTSESTEVMNILLTGEEENING